jgi:hypothetical protein
MPDAMMIANLLRHRGSRLSGNWSVGPQESGTLEGKAKLQVTH